MAAFNFCVSKNNQHKVLYNFFNRFTIHIHKKDVPIYEYKYNFRPQF